jgi:hypothetical protein
MHQAPPSSNNPLQRFVGSWRGEVQVDAPGGQPQRHVQESCWVWTLGETFLEERGAGSNGSSFLGLWRLDTRSGKYHAHYFLAPSGDAVVLTHEWNERERSFLGSADLGGGVLMRAEDRFVDRDTYEWSITVQNGDGEVLTRMRGRQHRLET